MYSLSLVFFVIQIDKPISHIVQENYPSEDGFSPLLRSNMIVAENHLGCESSIPKETPLSRNTTRIAAKEKLSQIKNKDYLIGEQKTKKNNCISKNWRNRTKNERTLENSIPSSLMSHWIYHILSYVIVTNVSRCKYVLYKYIYIYIIYIIARSNSNNTYVYKKTLFVKHILSLFSCICKCKYCIHIGKL